MHRILVKFDLSRYYKFNLIHYRKLRNMAHCLSLECFHCFHRNLLSIFGITTANVVSCGGPKKSHVYHKFWMKQNRYKNTQHQKLTANFVAKSYRARLCKVIKPYK